MASDSDPPALGPNNSVLDSVLAVNRRRAIRQTNACMTSWSEDRTWSPSPQQPMATARLGWKRAGGKVWH